MHKKISSSQNLLIKQIVQLKEKSRVRKSSKTFVIEGKREIEIAIKSNYIISTLLFCPDLCLKDDLELFLDNCVEIIEITKEVYQKIAHRGTTEGVIAIAKWKPHQISSVKFSNSKPLILVAEAPEKPGNIGAILRTADAANVDAVLIANPLTDLYNPNIIRSSVGCVFSNQIATGSTIEIIEFLKKHNVAIYCAALQASVKYTTQNFNEATAIVVGTEANGLSADWLNNSSQNIVIPMQGVIDSMNVSVAAGILIFEAKRQREI